MFLMLGMLDKIHHLNSEVKTKILLSQNSYEVKFLIRSIGLNALIKKLCRDNAAERLGYQKGEIRDIQKHK